MSRLLESNNYGICNSLEEFGNKVLRWPAEIKDKNYSSYR
jgi:hypothetical protein